MEIKNASVLSQTYTKVSKFDIVMDSMESMESIEICCFRTKSGWATLHAFLRRV